MKSDESKTKKKGRSGEGTVFWDDEEKTYIGQISLGYRPDGRRLRPKVRGNTIDEVHKKFKDLRDEHGSGVDLENKYTVAQACNDWFKRGLKTQGVETKKRLRNDLENHIIPGLGAAKLKKLTADDVDDFLYTKVDTHATSMIRRILGTLCRVIAFAERRNKVGRNVAKQTEAPTGTDGRESKSLTLDQGKALLKASQGRWINTYIALSMFTGVRTEEARPLKWKHTHLNPIEGETCSCGNRHAETLPPHVEVWRSVRVGGDTKTQKSRRTIALPQYVIEILKGYQTKQFESRKRNNHEYENIIYVFGTRNDTVMDARSVRKSFLRITKKAEIPGAWTPRELRHTFVSLLSDQGVSDQIIADLVGHVDTATLRAVYRKQLRPVITTGAEIFDKSFKLD